MNPLTRRIRSNGVTAIFHDSRAETKVLADFCNELADKLEEATKEINRLSEEIISIKEPTR